MGWDGPIQDAGQKVEVPRESLSIYLSTRMMAETKRFFITKDSPVVES
jgi:hypothetical protein